MKLIIVRHGTTDANVADIAQDDTSSLNAEGLRQAQKLALRLKNEPIDVIYSSDLIRCKQMAEAIQEYHPQARVHDDPRLCERNKGVFVGKQKDELKKAAIVVGVPDYEFRPEGGESFVDVCKRVAPFLTMIETQERGKRVFVVSHTITIRALLQVLLDLSYEEAFKIKKENASVSIIQVNDTKPHVAHVINDTRHLL